MNIKLTVIALVLSGALSGVVVAGGAHEQGHGQHGDSSTMEGAGHHKMPGMTHDEGHQHDEEGSPVGAPALAAQATKTIYVTTMDTMRYKFSPLPDIKVGDIVKFIITNQGKIPHEFSIGDENEQRAHQKMMRDMPSMVHEDGNTVTVQPGETKELTWKFRGNGEVVFACNIPGHYEAGMFKKVVLTQ